MGAISQAAVRQGECNHGLTMAGHRSWVVAG